MYDWFVDLSKWNSLTIPQAEQLVENGCVGFIIKAGQYNFEDSGCASNVAIAKEVGLPYAIYHWGDPIRSASVQVDFIKKLVDKYEPSAIALDMEQYWSDWAQWYRVVVEHSGETLSKFSALTLYNFYYHYMQLVYDNYHDELPIIGYSARWFIQAYCPTLGGVIENLCDYYWNAAYIRWKQYDQDPNVTWQEFHATLESLEPDKILLPTGIDKWDLWQFAVMPMAGWSKLDCDIITSEAKAIIFGDGEITPPEPPPPSEQNFVMEVVVDNLNVRAGPSINYPIYGQIHSGDRIKISDISGSSAWVQIAEGPFKGKWSAVQTSKRYMDPLP